MAVAPDKAVVDVIDAAALGYTLGTDLFRGEVRAPVPGQIPHKAVFALVTGGPAPQMQIAANEGPDIRTQNVQVRVRGNVGDFEATQDDAEAIYKALHRAEVAGYMSIEAIGEPQSLGQDDTEHPEWVLNFATIRED